MEKENKVMRWTIIVLFLILMWITYSTHLSECKRDPSNPDCQEKLYPW